MAWDVTHSFSFNGFFAGMSSTALSTRASTNNGRSMEVVITPFDSCLQHVRKKSLLKELPNTAKTRCL